jgi:hypothetical protein
MSVTSKKYYYYIDLGSGLQEIFPLKNELSLDFEVDKEWEAIAHKTLDGSFILQGSIFDDILAYILDNNEIVFKIYRDGTNLTGTLIFDGKITEFNNFDYNQKVVEFLKPICIETEQLTIQNTLKQLSRSCTFYGLAVNFTERTIKSNEFGANEIVTESAYRIEDVFNNAIRGGNIFELNTIWLDGSNCWFDYEHLDIRTLEACLIGSLRKNSTDIFTGSWQDLTAETILKFFRDAIGAYWYTENGALKFKNIVDFAQNTLDVTTKTQNKLVKKYNYSDCIRKLSLKAHPNNLLSSYTIDWIGREISFDREGFKDESIDISFFQTKYTRDANINTNGWFMAIVDIGESYDVMQVWDGRASGLSQYNVPLSMGDILYNTYQDYTYTDRKNWSWNLTESTIGTPSYLRPYIAYPNVTMVLTNPEVFYDSLLYAETETYQQIARVWKQSTKLSSNLTTFESFEFTKIAL